MEVVVVIVVRSIYPFRTAVSFWGQTSQVPSTLSPKRDCGSKRVNSDMPVLLISVGPPARITPRESRSHIIDSDPWTDRPLHSDQYIKVYNSLDAPKISGFLTRIPVQQYRTPS